MFRSFIVPIMGSGSDPVKGKSVAKSMWLEPKNIWEQTIVCLATSNGIGNLDLFDKGESISFTFAALLPFQNSVVPEAYKIVVKFSSDKSMRKGINVGWIREEIYLLDKQDVK